MALVISSTDKAFSFDKKIANFLCTFEHASLLCFSLKIYKLVDENSEYINFEFVSDDKPALSELPLSRFISISSAYATLRSIL